jgi:hypothetical protein
LGDRLLGDVYLFGGGVIAPGDEEPTVVMLPVDSGCNVQW